MYGQSGPIWRNLWKAESPEWNELLATDFDTLLASTPAQSPLDQSLSFSNCRNRFRHQLKESNGDHFPCGHKFSPVSKILEQIFQKPTMEPHARVEVVCQNCGFEQSKCQIGLVYIGCSFTIEKLHLNRDPLDIPLQLLIERYIAQAVGLDEGKMCYECRTQSLAGKLRLEETSWMWFELEADRDCTCPSLRINLNPLSPQHSHNLEAIIYLGQGHFTARIRNGSNEWWGYDGQWTFGTPRLETVAAERDLRFFGGRKAAFLIYRPCGMND